MNTALRSSHRLVKRGGAGLACDEDGVALGAVNLVSVSADAGGVRRCAVRSPDQISNILREGYAYIFNLAIKDDWATDLATNLIALPADENSQLSASEILPLHRTNHPNYNNDTLALILSERSTYPKELTPLQAHAIIQDVANINRAKILSGYYNPVMRVGR
jgi:hypothetical protein